MKKLLSVILTVTLLLGSVAGLSGCGKTEGVESLTRAEWISALAQQYNLTEINSDEPLFTDVKTTNPYFVEIQASAEWQIVESTGEFKPDEDATNGFAVISAVKAIGIALLEKSDYNASLQTDDEILDFFKTQSGVSVSADKALTVKQAEEILVKTQEIADGITLPQVYDVVFQDNVKQMDLNQITFSADGQTATLKSGTAEVGDIIAVEPSVYLPDGKYIKVTANNNGVLSYVGAEIDEILDNFEISGTFEPRILSVRPLSEGVTVTSIADADPVFNSLGYYGEDNISLTPYVTGGTPFFTPAADVYKNVGALSFSVNTTVGGAKVSGKVSVNFDKITLDYGNWFNPFNLQDSYLKIEDTVKAEIDVSGEFHKSIPLGTVELSAYGVVGVAADLSLNIGFDGSISVAVQVKTTETVTIPPYKGAKLSFSASDPSVSAHLEVKGYIRPDLTASVKVVGHKIAWVGVYSGIEARAVADLALSSASAESCLDLKAWVPLVIHFGYDFIVKKDQSNKEIWNENNSAWTKHLHIEDGVIVEECTRTGEEVDPELYDDDEGDVPENIDEDFINEAENLGYGDGLSISSFYVAMDPGSTDTLIVTHIPDGYSAGDLVFTSDNPGAVTVDNAGILSAVGDGSALVKVATSDGKYAQFCAVTSLASFDVDFKPLI
ncbi:MAG: Ig-like domain-containing protein [Clostridiales Family XIII bacterium]|jgi:hypothetical protein|nr:Ig-like domain-containing protein [Clostridiales Family XIII bacterium]